MALAILSSIRAYAIDAQVINGSSNINYFLYYDSNWVAVGAPVQVHVVASIFGGGSFEHSGGYNRSWENGDANYTLNPPAIWGYSIGGYTSYDQWFTIVPNEAGDFRIGIVVSSYPNLEQAHAYINFTAWAPTPGINSPTTVWAGQNQPINYNITATSTPTGFGADNLPSGLTLDPSTGAITGNIGTTGTTFSTITVSNSVGSDSKTLTWYVTPAEVVARPSVSPDTVYVGDPVILTRDGSTNFPLGWIESNVQNPDGTWDVFPATGYGSMSYVPGQGAGTYWFTVRVVDQYQNFDTKNVSFTVIDRAPLDPPSGLMTTAISSSTVSLSWNALAGAMGYLVYRDGVLIGTTASPNFWDSRLAANTTYQYRIYGYNAQEPQSAQFASISVTTAPAPADPLGDDDGDGIPNGVEELLGTNFQSITPSDSSNQLQLKINAAGI